VNAATPARREAAPIFSDPVAEAVGRAVEYWGGTPCGGTVDVVIAVNSEAPPAGQNAPRAPGHVAAMWATWLTPGGPNLFTEPASSFGECVVHVNRGIWPSTQAEDANFGAFCKEMLHEYGHFDGHPDVGAAAFTIEYERPDLAHVPLCERYRLYYGHRLYSRPPPQVRTRQRAQTLEPYLTSATRFRCVVRCASIFTGCGASCRSPAGPESVPTSM
jgi:hypothetical protein